MEEDWLFLLTDVDRLYSADPRHDHTQESFLVREVLKMIVQPILQFCTAISRTVFL